MFHLNSHNEWDRLRHVVVGTMEGKVLTPHEEEAVKTKLRVFKGLIPESDQKVIEAKTLDNAHEVAALLVETYAGVLKDEGIEVHRPTVYDTQKPYNSPFFSAKHSSGVTCPRDVFFVHGQNLIEATMSWRCRYFENLAYRPLFLDLWRRDNGLNWIAAPKPLLVDSSFGHNLTIQETEILFDAADCRRFGKDCFVQRGHTANDLGREWIARALKKDGVRVHLYESMMEATFSHLDAKVTPVSDSNLLYVEAEQPADSFLNLFKENEWNLIKIPKRQTWTSARDQTGLGIHLNMLTIRPNVVVCEKTETDLIKALTAEGIDCIPLDFSIAYEFGGSFNCWTLDIQRDSELKSYLPSLDKDSEDQK